MAINRTRPRVGAPLALISLSSSGTISRLSVRCGTKSAKEVFRSQSTSNCRTRPRIEARWPRVPDTAIVLRAIVGLGDHVRQDRVQQAPEFLGADVVEVDHLGGESRGFGARQGRLASGLLDRQDCVDAATRGHGQIGAGQGRFEEPKHVGPRDRALGDHGHRRMNLRRNGELQAEQITQHCLCDHLNVGPWKIQADIPGPQSGHRLDDRMRRLGYPWDDGGSDRLIDWAWQPAAGLRQPMPAEAPAARGDPSSAQPAVASTMAQTATNSPCSLIARPSLARPGRRRPPPRGGYQVALLQHDPASLDGGEPPAQQGISWPQADHLARRAAEHRLAPAPYMGYAHQDVVAQDGGGRLACAAGSGSGPRRAEQRPREDVRVVQPQVGRRDRRCQRRGAGGGIHGGPRWPGQLDGDGGHQQAADPQGRRIDLIPK